MTNLGRRIREGAGIALTWGAAWILAGFLVARLPGFDSDLPFAFLFAPFAIVTGILFFGILVGLEGGGGLERISPWHFAAWGAASGVLLAAVIATLRGPTLGREILVLGPLFALAGAASAARSLVMARRAQSATLASAGGAFNRS